MAWAAQATICFTNQRMSACVSVCAPQLSRAGAKVCATICIVETSLVSSTVRCDANQRTKNYMYANQTFDHVTRVYPEPYQQLSPDILTTVQQRDYQLNQACQKKSYTFR
jgi:hypothetical protein